MNQRDRLIELLDNAFVKCDDNYGMPNSSQVADYLIANGVIVPPCKVGDKVYFAELVFNKEIKGYVHKIKRTKILSLEINRFETFYRCENGNIYFWYMIGKTVFLTLKEAEKALEEMKK